MNDLSCLRLPISRSLNRTSKKDRRRVPCCFGHVMGRQVQTVFHLFFPLNMCSFCLLPMHNEITNIYDLSIIGPYALHDLIGKTCLMEVGFTPTLCVFLHASSPER